MNIKIVNGRNETYYRFFQNPASLTEEQCMNYTKTFQTLVEASIKDISWKVEWTENPDNEGWLISDGDLDEDDALVAAQLEVDEMIKRLTY